MGVIDSVNEWGISIILISRNSSYIFAVSDRIPGTRLESLNFKPFDLRNSNVEGNGWRVFDLSSAI